MPQPKRGLGKGLGALIPTGPPSATLGGSYTPAPAAPPRGSNAMVRHVTGGAKGPAAPLPSPVKPGSLTGP